MSKYVLVINAGSSSIKFQLFEGLSKFSRLAKGLIEKIAEPSSSTSITFDKDANGKFTQQVFEEQVKSHRDGLGFVMNQLQSIFGSSLNADVKAVGHRVVHGFQLNDSALINQEVLEQIKKGALLAPLHNPHHLEGIYASQAVFKQSTQVAVFDTAFHTSMPPEAYMYALPYRYYEQYHVRRYGMHGTSYLWMVRQISQVLQKPIEQLNLIGCHIGNGSSMAAIQNGKCIDTSMGMTPLEGLVMGTRCGDIDPAIIPYIMKQENLNADQIDKILNKESGLKGICNSNDIRQIQELFKQGDEMATLALKVFVKRIRKYIGSYLVALGGKVDGIVFTAGIGENSVLVRQLALEGLEDLGIKLDDEKNKQTVGQLINIEDSSSKIKIFVVPCDEELCIAQEAVRISKVK